MIAFNKYYNHFNFISGILIICSLVLLIFKGLNFGIDFKGFWKPKWSPKFDFPGFFFDVIFQCVWASDFDGFLEALNQKIAIFLEENNDFCKMGV